MGWPGEQLLGRLWETLADKGVGSLLRPGQMKREGLVALELERAKLLSIAQSERDAEDIKFGRKELSDFSLELNFNKRISSKGEGFCRTEPTIDLDDALNAGRLRLLQNAVRSEVNTASSILYAEEALRSDSQPPPDEKIDDDWLYRWGDYTGDVSNDDLQRMWGRLLAGEVKAPGTYSLRCLEFLRNLSQAEAKLIELMSTYVTEGVIWRPKDTFEMPLSFNDFLDLQDLGIVTGVDSTGLNFHMEDKESSNDGFLRVIESHGKCLVISNANKRAELNFPIYSVTKLGRQIVTLGRFEPNEKYLRAFGAYIKSMGYSVEFTSLVERGPNYVTWRNGGEIL